MRLLYILIIHQQDPRRIQKEKSQELALRVLLLIETAEKEMVLTVWINIILKLSGPVTLVPEEHINPQVP